MPSESPPLRADDRVPGVPKNPSSNPHISTRVTGIPDPILQKPGRLTEEEFAAIKTHPEIGARLLRGLKPLEKLLPGVMHHHESVDGSGYPHGLKGQDIPLMARILAVADAFDAMTSDRPYRDGMSLAKAATILRAGQGTQWDVEVVDAFFAAQADMERICEHYKKSPTPIPSNDHSQSTIAPLAVESLPPIDSTIAANC